MTEVWKYPPSMLIVKFGGDPMTGIVTTGVPESVVKTRYQRCPNRFQTMVAVYTTPSKVG